MPLEQWTTALLFSSLSERAILRALDVLLLEKTLVVCGKDLAMVSREVEIQKFETEGVPIFYRLVTLSRFLYEA